MSISPIRLLNFTAILLSALAVSGQTTEATIIAPGPLPIPVTQRVVFGYPVVSAVGFPPGWNLVSVLPGSTVRLELHPEFTDVSEVTWIRSDGREFDRGDEGFWEIYRFLQTDNGSYHARFVRNGRTEFSNELNIQMTPFSMAPLKNLSSRTRISPENPQLIVGFVIDEEGAVARQKRSLLVRAIGPSLSNFEVTAPLPDPQIKLLDSAGKVIEQVQAWDGKTGIPITPWDTYEEYLATLMNHIGAFPIPQNETDSGTSALEPVHEYRIPPGNYTLVTNSITGSSGDVLVEVYEFRQSDLEHFYQWPTPVTPSLEARTETTP